MSWVLILTLSMGVDSGVAIQAIEGFSSRQACAAAAQEWRKATYMRDDQPLRRGFVRSAVCVSTETVTKK
jgi:hypothetical protein